MMLRRLLVAGVSLVLFSVGGVAVAGDPGVTTTDRSGFKSASLPAGSKFTQVKGSKFSPSAVYALGFLENRRLVSAELGYPGDFNGMLRARADVLGPWEQFDLTWDGSFWNLRSTANGLYVSAELGYGGDFYGMLRARAGGIGPWEQFNLYTDGSGVYALQSAANGLFVSEELGYGGDFHAMLRARSGGIGPWEVFVFVV